MQMRLKTLSTSRPIPRPVATSRLKWFPSLVWFRTPAWLVVVMLCMFSPSGLHAAEHSRKPNVVLILADDLGWSDTTLFGTTDFYQTPNIERLAERGMTFPNAYSSSPLCSPTRASILTGLSPARHGITAPNCHLRNVVLKASEVASGSPKQKATIPTTVTRLSTDYYTLAKMFHDNGYATGHFGKWHLGHSPYTPLEHGFDVDIPHHPGPGPAGSYVAPWRFDNFDPDPDTPDEHLEDRMAKEAVAFMEKHKDEPFFLNYWMFSVHAPFDAKQGLIDKYKTKVDPKNPQRSPTYAAMIESMDDAVGTLLDALDRLALSDNTIIIFASDNGGNMYNEVDGTTATSNAPLRGGKATMYEGGVRGPAIFVQPGSIAANSRSEEIIQSSDFYPTLLDMLSIKPQPNQTFDGISIVPALHGKSLDREAIFTYFPHSPGVPEWLPPSISVHQGDWKLIRIFHGGDDGKHRYLLFNLKEDVGERNNLAAEEPERVRRMDDLVEQHLIATQAARPLPNPAFDSAQYDPSLEGKGRLKGGANAPKKKGKAKPPGKPVAGWRPGGTCTLSAVNGVLRVNSTGPDPHMMYALSKPINEDALVLRFTMKSHSEGSGQIFWRKNGQPFGAARSQEFDIQHDGKPHEYAIKLAVDAPIHGVRIDPSRGAGTIDLSAIRMTKATKATQAEGNEEADIEADKEGIEEGIEEEVLYKWTLPLSAAAPGSTVLRTVTANTAEGPSDDKDHPNVLFVLTEDQGAHLSLLNTPGLKTPQIDALARSGVYFDNAFVVYPVCSASKAAIYTGLYGHTNGILNNTHNFHMPADQVRPAQRAFELAKTNRVRDPFQTLPEILKRAGYYQGVTHKLHVLPNEKFPFDEFLHGDAREIANFFQTAQQQQQPWFLMVNIPNSHRPYPNSDKTPIRVDPSDVKLPGYLPDSPPIRKDWAEYLAGIEQADALTGQALRLLDESGQAENTIVIFMSDHGPTFQHGKMTLYDLGLRVPLIIRAPESPRRGVCHDLVTELDLLPTILDLCEIEHSFDYPLNGKSLVDVLTDDATGDTTNAVHDFVFAEISNRGPLPNDGIQERSVFDGRWKLIYRENVEKAWRQVNADSRQFKTWGNRTYAETIRLKDQFPDAYRILTEMDPQELNGQVPRLELYDLNNDPDELHNLANDPSHAETVASLIHTLGDWCRETDDQSVHITATGAVD